MNILKKDLEKVYNLTPLYEENTHLKLIDRGQIENLLSGLKDFSDFQKRIVGESGIISKRVEIADDEDFASQKYKLPSLKVKLRRHIIEVGYTYEAAGKDPEVIAELGEEESNKLLSLGKALLASAIVVTNKVVLELDEEIEKEVKTRKNAKRTVSSLFHKYLSQKSKDFFNNTKHYIGLREDLQSSIINIIEEVEVIASTKIKKTVGTLYLSALPSDIATASTNSSLWRSCFEITRGEYALSPLMYILGQDVLVSYFIPDGKKGTLELNGEEYSNKYWRMFMFKSNNSDEVIGFTKSYPVSSATLLKASTEFLKDVYGEYELLDAEEDYYDMDGSAYYDDAKYIFNPGSGSDCDFSVDNYFYTVDSEEHIDRNTGMLTSLRSSGLARCEDCDEIVPEDSITTICQGEWYENYCDNCISHRRVIEDDISGELVFASSATMFYEDGELLRTVVRNWTSFKRVLTLSSSHPIRLRGRIYTDETSVDIEAIKNKLKEWQENFLVEKIEEISPTLVEVEWNQYSTAPQEGRE